MSSYFGNKKSKKARELWVGGDKTGREGVREREGSAIIGCVSIQTCAFVRSIGENEVLNSRV